MNKEHLQDLYTWLTADCIDDPEDLFDEAVTITGLIEFWFEQKGYVLTTEQEG